MSQDAMLSGRRFIVETYTCSMRQAAKINLSLLGYLQAHSLAHSCSLASSLLSRDVWTWGLDHIRSIVMIPLRLREVSENTGYRGYGTSTEHGYCTKNP
jgi:hypothetical protein